MGEVWRGRGNFLEKVSPSPSNFLPLVAHPDGDALAVEIFEKRDDVLAGKAAGKLLEPGGIEIVM